MAFYYAQTDENRVLCVDQLDGGDTQFTFEEVAKIANSYPNTIYFAADRYFCTTYTCGECRGCKTAKEVQP